MKNTNPPRRIRKAVAALAPPMDDDRRRGPARRRISWSRASGPEGGTANRLRPPSRTVLACGRRVTGATGSLLFGGRVGISPSARSIRTVALAVLCTAGLVLAVPGPAAGHPEHTTDGGYTAADGARDAKQHAGAPGHLPATQSNVALISKLSLKNAEPEKIADVGVFNGYAYLAAWGVVTCKYNGVHVVDINNVSAPKEVAFIRAKTGSYPGEGVQALHIDTPAFKGDILVTNNEKCNETSGFGGMNIYDVSNPRHPVPLAEGAGDFTVNGQGKKAANEIHSVFAWDAGDKAYAVMVDNEEGKDLDFMDITDPKKPVLIAEYDLDERFPQIRQAAPNNLTEVFLHDMVVKKIGGDYVMSASYWDAGYVQLNVNDPRDIYYLNDTHFADPDPELFESTGRSEKPEGNAHQSEFTRDNRFLIGADEDFYPMLTVGRTDDMGSADFYSSQGSGTPQLRDGESLSGDAVYVGRACTGDAAVPPAPSTPSGRQIAVVARGLCLFTEKVTSVQATGGYEGIVVVNREGSDGGCLLFGMNVNGDIPTFAVDRETGFGFFDKQGSYDHSACLAGTGSEIPGVALGAVGDRIDFRRFFDGWGSVRLFDANSGAELDTYAIPEAHQLDKAKGFGDLSVHEVATSHQRDDLAYLSYYSGGVRVIKITGTEIEEVGRFIDEGGSNFWGVEVFQSGGKEYIAASDRDYGLYIFEYTGAN